MRITSTSMFTTFQNGLANALNLMNTYETQLASGQKISRYSDDPVGAVSALRSRAEESAYASYQRSADDATTWLSSADTALQTMATTVQRIQTLSVQAVNGSLDATARSAITAEISSLRQQLADLANTKNQGRPVFGGFADTAVAATTNPDGSVSYAWAGDNGAVLRQVSPNTRVQVNVDGNALFGFSGGPGQDLFSQLSQLVSDISSNNLSAVAADQSALSAAADRINGALGLVGATQNRVGSATSAGTAAVQTLVTQRSAIEDTDIAAATLHLQEAQNAYQATLGAIGRADLPSLAEFLK